MRTKTTKTPEKTTLYSEKFTAVIEDKATTIYHSDGEPMKHLDWDIREDAIRAFAVGYAAGVRRGYERATEEQTKSKTALGL